ncbi:MAG: DUF87 domain-containing protein [Caryophanon sp.]|nr:DUF87 domain-containing protein [Caryophanon sp.]
MMRRTRKAAAIDTISLAHVLDDATIEAIYPFSIEEQHDYMLFGSTYVRVLMIIDYPNEAYGNWLSELRRKKGNITFVQHIKGISGSKMLEHYNKSIKNKHAELLKTLDPLKRRKIELQIEAAELQLDKYLGNETTYIYQYTYINLQAKSLEELNALTDSVKTTLLRLRLVPMIPTKAQFQAFWSTVPIVENLLPEYTEQQSNSEVASSMFPFSDSELLDLQPSSDIEGVNVDTGSLIAINHLNPAVALNQNIVVIGTAGVGKTTYMMQKILSYIARGIKVFIIDPENEYSDIIRQLGGEVIHLSSNATTIINPLEIVSEHVLDDTEEHTTVAMLVRDRIQRVLALFQSMKPNISAVEKAILDSVLLHVYEQSGIFNRSFKELTPTDYPTLKHVYEALQQLQRKEPDRFQRIEDFMYILEAYVNGSRSLFNGHTNINLHAPFISFNLKALQNEPDVRSAAYLNVFSYLWDDITKNRTEIVKLVVDEFHFLTQNPDAASFFYQAYKRFRKYKAGAIAGTQQIQDVLDGKLSEGKQVGEAIIGNSYTKVFFGLDDSGVDDIVRRLSLKLSEREKKLLSRKKQGEALIIHGIQRAFMRVTLSEEELRLIDPIKYEREYGHAAHMPTNYSANISFSQAELNDINNYMFDKR